MRCDCCCYDCRSFNHKDCHYYSHCDDYSLLPLAWRWSSSSKSSSSAAATAAAAAAATRRHTAAASAAAAAAAIPKAGP